MLIQAVLWQLVQLNPGHAFMDLVHEFANLGVKRNFHPMNLCELGLETAHNPTGSKILTWQHCLLP